MLLRFMKSLRSLCWDWLWVSTFHCFPWSDESEQSKEKYCVSASWVFPWSWRKWFAWQPCLKSETWIRVAPAWEGWERALSPKSSSLSEGRCLRSLQRSVAEFSAAPKKPSKQCKHHVSIVYAVVNFRQSSYHQLEYFIILLILQSKNFEDLEKLRLWPEEFIISQHTT